MNPARVLAAAAVSCLVGGVFAADTTEPAPRATDPLASVRAHLSAQRWSGAIADLQKLGATGSADWNNLMGYALRKSSPPDLEGAQRHYDMALRIDPRHRGALEYAGELALMKGQPAQAEEKLATLRAACGASCEEASMLQKAIDRFKANGNRWLP